MTSEQTNEKQTFKIKLEKHETGEATGTIEELLKRKKQLLEKFNRN